MAKRNRETSHEEQTVDVDVDNGSVQESPVPDVEATPAPASGAEPRGVGAPRGPRHVPTTPAELAVWQMRRDANTAGRVIRQIQALPVGARRIVKDAVAAISTEET